MNALPAHSVIALNTSISSENKIHDDTVAQVYGFKGGLVPGVDVYAYMTHPAVAHWGRDWLERGRSEVRLLKPVYDGDEVTVNAALDDDGMAIEVVSEGLLCAAGRAELPAAANSVPAIEDYALAPRPAPEARPPASFESIVVGQALGTVHLRFDPAAASGYLDDVRESLPLFGEEELMHPGWLSRRGNDALKENVLLGPWIHVSSHIRHFRAVAGATEIEVRGRVVATYERKGHQFVDLDVLVLETGGEAIAQIDHTAIFRPRRDD